jgi:predicted RecB family nuclease
MRLYNGRMLYSATDLVTFLGCSHATMLDRRALTETLEKSDDDEMNVLLQRLGHKHEQAYLQQLQSAGLSVVTIEGESLEKRNEATVDAMRAGVDIIYQATFFAPPWHGHADFLRRVEAKTAFGEYGYEVVDTKLSRHAKASHIIQLCVYNDLLASAQGAKPRLTHLVLGDGRGEVFQVSEFVYFYRSAKHRFEQFVIGEVQGTAPEPCSKCQTCHWRNRCESHWLEIDHLSQVAGITRNQISKLRAGGVLTVSALAKMPAQTAVPDIAAVTFEKIRSQAAIQEEGRKGAKPVFRLCPRESGRGFDRLPEPDAADVFFDIEGDPLYPDGLEYLFGLHYFEQGVAKFKAIWAHDQDQERIALAELLDFLWKRMERNPRAHIYHFAAYEVSALKRLTARYGIGEHRLDQFLRMHRFVDLYTAVREGMRTSEPKYSIKNLERFYMEARHGEVASGSDSIVAYENWRNSQDQTTLDQIASYNRDDLKSTYLLREWLAQIRPSDAKWFLPPKDEAHSDDPNAHVERERRRSQLAESLVNRAAEHDRPYRQLLGDLLAFYRRAAKPDWWAMFDRTADEVGDLIDDAECLGGLVSLDNGAPRTVKLSYHYRYKFPPQDTKLQPGDKTKLVPTLGQAGKIVAIDGENHTVTVTRGKRSGPLPTELSLIPAGPRDTKVLELAVYRYAENVSSGAETSTALRDFMTRSAPRIKTRRPAEPVIRDEMRVLNETIDAVSALDNSYIYIQGPPGAGKTYTSAAVIVELLRNGGRVAVSSSSHKAINNLLKAIEDQAAEQNFVFSGVKKSNEDKPESLINGVIIKDVFDNKDVPADAQLVAGTAWLFSRDEHIGQFSHLFIDEAGQVSLANIVAMGQCARNIVLVGDQMQLSQPIKGVHPGASGLSALDYLLGGEATVAKDRGIFLPTTWRMHNDLCQFISDAVYDSRLKPEPHTAQQKLISATASNIALPSAGLQYFSVKHAGCSQKSEEEGQLVLSLVSQLCRSEYIDREGGRKPITLDDILVVTPYNVQVNYLKSILPAGARVGTVDKFQGQEAQVVIISMVTSGADDMPRNVEFLLSKNRLNVAISRAKTLACLIASEGLLEVPCSSPDQMRLVNTLCWARDYANELNASGDAGHV